MEKVYTNGQFIYTRSLYRFVTIDEKEYVGSIYFGGADTEPELLVHKKQEREVAVEEQDMYDELGRRIYSKYEFKSLCNKNKEKIRNNPIGWRIRLLHSFGPWIGNAYPVYRARIYMSGKIRMCEAIKNNQKELTYHYSRGDIGNPEYMERISENGFKKLYDTASFSQNYILNWVKKAKNELRVNIPNDFYKFLNEIYAIKGNQIL